MGKPSHFRMKSPKRCCKNCRFKRLDITSYHWVCSKHDFELPEGTSSLETHVCDDFEKKDGE